ncbi:MAG: sulfatase-like hydrolase/transferase [Ruminiclostridium sp.]|nr:sulfatase-like hydrolase/transferase [Ruminiclostridium sp.]
MNILLKRFKPSERTEKIVGWIIAVINAFSGAVISYTSGVDRNIIISGVAFVLMAVLFGYFKMYRIYFGNILPVHIGALIYALLISSHLITPNEFDTQIGMVLVFISRSILLFLAIEVVFRLIMLLADKDGDHPENLKWAFMVLVPLFFTVNVYLPSETYFGSYRDFLYSYIDFAPFLLVRTIIYSVVFASVICTFRKKLFDVIVRIASGAMLCVYVQYMFFNSDIRSHGGKPVEWDSLTEKGIFNAIVWAVVLMLPFAAYLISKKVKSQSAKDIISRSSFYASGFLGAIELVTLVAMIFTTEADLVSHGMIDLITTDEQYVVSGKKNMITFIVDMGDVKFFEKRMKEDPEAMSFLNDFTYYDNCCMLCDSTFVSIPSMLTGESIYDSQTMEDWYEQVWNTERSNEFYSRLHENNYKVNIIGEFQYDYKDLEGKADNVEKVQKKFRINRLMFESIDSMSRYRYAPILLKRFTEPNWNSVNFGFELEKRYVFTNESFLDGMQLSKAENDSNYFIVEHIMGMQWINWWTAGPEGSMDQTVEILGGYIEQLKQLGVYDDAVIVITADHGIHMEPDGIPVFFIKTAGEKHDQVQINHAPIHLLDFQATCIEALGLSEDGDDELFGRSVFEIGEDEERERLVYQRNDFSIVGDGVPYDNPDINDILWGYYYTGDRNTLMEKELTSPPDTVCTIVESYGA